MTFIGIEIKNFILYWTIQIYDFLSEFNYHFVEFDVNNKFESGVRLSLSDMIRNSL